MAALTLSGRVKARYSRAYSGGRISTGNREMMDHGFLTNFNSGTDSTKAPAAPLGCLAAWEPKLSPVVAFDCDSLLSASSRLALRTTTADHHCGPRQSRQYAGRNR